MANHLTYVRALILIDTLKELLLYLLQLVQALKFERISPEAPEEATQDSSLARFLISRAANNFTLGNYFHWYLMVECDDRTGLDQTGDRPSNDHRKLFARVEYDFMTELMKVVFNRHTLDQIYQLSIAD